MAVLIYGAIVSVKQLLYDSQYLVERTDLARNYRNKLIFFLEGGSFTAELLDQASHLNY